MTTAMKEGTIPAIANGQIAAAIAINEMAKAGLAPPLTPNEWQMLAVLLDPSSKLVVKIPPNATKDDLMVNLDFCCRGAKWADSIFRKINPVVGRILMVMRDNPDTYTSQGFAKFGDFVVEYVEKRLGYSRSSSYESMRLIKIHPNLEIEDWLEIGSSRLGTLARFTKDGDPSYEKHVAVARQARTDAEFKQWAIEHGHITKGEFDRATIYIECTKLQEKEWKELVSDPRVHAAAGGSSMELVLDAIMGEASSLLSENGNGHSAVAVAAVAIWRCEACKHAGIVPPGYDGETLDDLRNYLREAHRETNPDCTEMDGDLMFSMVRDAEVA